AIFPDRDQGTERARTINWRAAAIREASSVCASADVAMLAARSTKSAVLIPRPRMPCNDSIERLYRHAKRGGVMATLANGKVRYIEIPATDASRRGQILRSRSDRRILLASARGILRPLRVLRT